MFRSLNPSASPAPLKWITTDTEVSKEDLLKTINKVTSHLLQSAKDMFGLHWHEDIELVIGPIYNDTERETCPYYFVDHQRQLLFWVHPYAPSKRNMFVNVWGSTLSKPSTGNPVDSFLCKIIPLSDIQTRTHIELYPNRRQLKEEHYTELKGILIHASADTLTSHASVAPFDSDELGRMLDLIDRTEGSIGKEHVYAVEVNAVVQFINFYGQPGARLSADQSLYSASSAVKRKLRVWVDGTVNAPRWKGFVSNLNSEWADFTIYVLMLAVDVSFLAIPALATGATGTTEEPGAIISTYVSIIFVVGSLVVSVQLSNRLRGQESLLSEKPATMMFQSTQSMLGTDGFAIMHSLPFGLLIWGMIFFLLALCFVVFGAGGYITLGTIAPAAIIVGFLTVWSSFGNRGNFAALSRWMRMKLYEVRRRGMRGICVFTTGWTIVM
ncbi:hypothetical protein BU15DRAFT_82508 [Melanogaster broomeanus]|nr:hypothetical protein BU15DRAFT_82508 [Melanogaster broomeanus]